MAKPTNVMPNTTVLSPFPFKWELWYALGQIPRVLMNPTVNANADLLNILPFPSIFGTHSTFRGVHGIPSLEVHLELGRLQQACL